MFVLRITCKKLDESGYHQDDAVIYKAPLELEIQKPKEGGDQNAKRVKNWSFFLLAKVFFKPFFFKVTLGVVTIH